MKPGPKPRPLKDRFWPKVEKAGPGDCWLWTAGVDGHGYGKVKIEGRCLKASRVSWELHNGAIPEGLDVCHSCDTPLCVNPSHLWLGTQLDNMRDMAAKGRRAVRKPAYCKFGHKFTAKNTYHAKTQRVCRICRKETKARYRARQRLNSREAGVVGQNPL